MDDLINKIIEFYKTHHEPIITKYEAKVISFDPTSHEKVERFQIHYPLIVEFDREKIEISGGQFCAYQDLEWLFKNWQYVKESIEKLKKINSPFYSDVYQYFNDKHWQDSLAYCFVCKKLTQFGKTIHSD